MKKVYIKKYKSGAGKWIYQGYHSAWQSLGYDVEYYQNLSHINPDEDYYVMASDADISSFNINRIKDAEKSFVYVQPNRYPIPWGTHSNFVSECPVDIVRKLNSFNNTYLWNFASSFPYHTMWSNVSSIPLAFDSINYKSFNKPPDRYLNDIVFIGGRANNGFDEKIYIMKEMLDAFVQSGLRCAFYVDRNIFHDKENELLLTSKVSLNIHDAYQRQLGLDTNERTFKSIGINGLLVSDDVDQVTDIFPNVHVSNDPKSLIAKVKEYCSFDDNTLLRMKRENIQNVLDNHTYVERVKEMLNG